MINFKLFAKVQKKSEFVSANMEIIKEIMKGFQNFMLNFA